MKFSMHTIIVEDYPIYQEHLLYNTRTQALVKINQDIKDKIDQYSFYQPLLTDADKKNFSVLHEMGLIVKDETEDVSRLKSHLEQIKYGVENSCLVLTILTTYACNFKCSYCFQESSRTFEKMSDETSEHVLQWIKAKMMEFGYEQLFLNFYGGEPLMNKPALEKIATHMKGWCKEKGVKFKFMMQTNGFLMTPHLIDQYKTMGLDQVRISVDGVEEDHDRTRPLRNGKGTFDTVMKNIYSCVDKIKIGLSVSFDKGDIRHIERLLDYLDNLGILHKLGQFIVAPVHATLGPKGQAEKIVGSQCMKNYDNAELIESIRKINTLMERKGLSIDAGMSTSVCPLTRDHSGGTIDQHGRIYKCNSMLGHPELATGDVRKNNYNEMHQQFIHLDVWKQCPQDCTYMPMCSGGCRLSSFLKNQNFKAPSCHKPYLNKMAPEFVKKEYERKVAKIKQEKSTEMASHKN